MTSRWFAALAVVAAASMYQSVRADMTVVQVASMSGSNGSDLGQGLMVGQRIVFDSINEAGGIAGQSIRLVTLDDKYIPQETVRLAERALQENDPVAFIGFRGTANTMALVKSGLLEKNSIALVGTLTGAEDLQRAKNIFHTRTSYAKEVGRLADLVTALGTQRIALLSVEDAFGRSGRLAAVEALRGKQVSLVADRTYVNAPATLSADLATAAKEIRASGAQAVVVVAVGDPVYEFVKLMREADPGMQVFALSVVSPSIMIARVGTASAGIGFSQVFPMSAAVPMVRDYLALMKKYAPDVAPGYFSLEGYVNARLLVNALRRAGPNPTRQTVLAALQQTKELDLGGFYLNYRDDKTNGSKYTELTVIGRNGKLHR